MERPLEAEFDDKCTVRGGVMLFKPADAVAFVEEARRRGLPILGIDGFLLEADFIQPILEETADYSGAVFAHDDAIAFLNERMNRNLYFEIVIG